MERTEDPSSGPRSASGPGHERNTRGKASLRAGIRSVRRDRRAHTSDAERVEASHAVTSALLEYPGVVTARCIALYEALPTEESVAALTHRAPAAERFIVPITLENKDLSWRDLTTSEDLGVNGIAAADVVVVPALAIGPAGERLGQGGGSYDRALPRRSPGAPVIAVVFPDEVGHAIPTESHDEPVDAVATREGLTVFELSGQPRQPGQPGLPAGQDFRAGHSLD